MERKGLLLLGGTFRETLVSLKVAVVPKAMTGSQGANPAFGLNS